MSSLSTYSCRSALWVKRIDVSAPAQSFAATENVCAKKAITPEIRDAWIQVYETLYRTVMGELDRHVSPDEFVALKVEADILKEKKAY